MIIVYDLRLCFMKHGFDFSYDCECGFYVKNFYVFLCNRIYECM